MIVSPVWQKTMGAVLKHLSSNPCAQKANSTSFLKSIKKTSALSKEYNKRQENRGVSLSRIALKLLLSNYQSSLAVNVVKAPRFLRTQKSRQRLSLGPKTLWFVIFIAMHQKAGLKGSLAPIFAWEAASFSPQKQSLCLYLYAPLRF